MQKYCRRASACFSDFVAAWHHVVLKIPQQQAMLCPVEWLKNSEQNSVMTELTSLVVVDTINGAVSAHQKLLEGTRRRPVIADSVAATAPLTEAFVITQ